MNTRPHSSFTYVQTAAVKSNILYIQSSTVIDYKFEALECFHSAAWVTGYFVDSLFTYKTFDEPMKYDELLQIKQPSS